MIRFFYINRGIVGPTFTNLPQLVIDARDHSYFAESNNERLYQLLGGLYQKRHGATWTRHDLALLALQLTKEDVAQIKKLTLSTLTQEPWTLETAYRSLCQYMKLSQASGDLGAVFATPTRDTY